MQAARQAWPGVALADGGFLAALTARAPDDETLSQLLVADLFLAWACLQGDRAALEHLDASVLSRVPEAVRSIDSSGAFCDEVKQRVRERLLLGVDGKPKLLEYGGKGPLAKWTRVVAVRLALSLKESQKPEHELDEVPELAAADESPEVRLLKTRHGKDFTEAFQAAIGGLSPRDRNLLRLAYVDRLNVDEIGRIYGTHRSTAARQVAGARDAVLHRTRELLAERLRLSGSQVDSLIGAVRSQLDVSLNRLLKD